MLSIGTASMGRGEAAGGVCVCGRIDCWSFNQLKNTGAPRIL